MANARLTAEQTVIAGIRLLEALSAAPGQTLRTQDATVRLGVDSAQLTQVVETLSALSDRSSGARAAVEITDDRVTLQGDAALIMPRRFSLEESMVLAHVLDVLDLDADTRERIRRALGPVDGRAERPGIAEPARYGSWFSQLSEAIEDGIRCTMSYRSLTDDTARERLIDPLSIQEEHGDAYLVAWDVQKDAERRYRLDRISGLAFTDESVDAHEVGTLDIAESLHRAGTSTRLRLRAGASSFMLDWAGVADIVRSDDGSTEFTLFYSSKPWLFDQVLAMGGDIEMLEPAELRDELLVYANALLDSISNG